MTTEEALQSYNKISSTVFSSENRKPFYRDGKFKATTLEKEIKNIVCQARHGNDQKLFDPNTGPNSKGNAYVPFPLSECCPHSLRLLRVLNDQNKPAFSSAFPYVSRTSQPRSRLQDMGSPRVQPQQHRPSSRPSRLPDLEVSVPITSMQAWDSTTPRRRSEMKLKSCLDLIGASACSSASGQAILVLVGSSSPRNRKGPAIGAH